ncbi:MAG: GntR family transcriptional regulator [Pseudomonadota bacterium]
MTPNPSPLYAQVMQILRDRMAAGEWRAGQALPSEFALADEIGVSQGTVRKALNAMAAENLLDRRQGKGTFMPEHTPQRALYHFFRLVRPDGTPALPELIRQTITRVPPEPALNKALGAGRRQIWKIDRVRALDGLPSLVEQSYLDPAAFPDLTPETDLPNALYTYYQAHGGHTVVRATDTLGAEAAPPEVAKALNLPKGTAVMLAEREAQDVAGQTIEIRRSWIATRTARYRVTLK